MDQIEFSSQKVGFGDSCDELDDDMVEKIDKNPLRLHQTEIIALLALDLLKASQNIINPVTKEPFNVKFGKDFQFIIPFLTID